MGPWSIRITRYGSGAYAAASPARGPIPSVTAATHHAWRSAAALHLMVFDGGTGLRLLGNELMSTGQPAELDLFYSHTHFDHICGLPFFAPCYDARSRIRIWAGHLNGKGIEAVLNNMMIAPLFPIPMGIFTAKIDFIDFTAGDALVPHPGVRLSTGPLNHPNECHRLPHRIWRQDRRLYHRYGASGGRAGSQCPKADRRRRCDDLRCLLHRRRIPARRDWGHSTWQEGVRLGQCGEGKDPGDLTTTTLVTTMPSWTRSPTDAAIARPGTIVAQEGLVLRP